MQKHCRPILSILLVYSLSSCNNNRQAASRNSNNYNDSITIQSGKDWLKNNIESFFNNDNNFKKGFSYLCTSQYAEFKTDATNVDLDGGMTEPQFKSKWGRRYSKYAGVGEGFMISGTDFGKIEVAKCEFRNMTEMKNFLYDVLIVDKTFNSKFTRQVVLVKNGNSFLIDNVLEISNEFKSRTYNRITLRTYAFLLFIYPLFVVSCDRRPKKLFAVSFEQSVPKSVKFYHSQDCYLFDCCLWLHFKIDSTDLNKLLKNGFHRDKLYFDKWSGVVPPEAKGWWHPEKLGDSALYFSKESETTEDGLFTNAKKNEVYHVRYLR